MQKHFLFCFTFLFSLFSLCNSEVNTGLTGKLDKHIQEYVEEESFQGAVLVAKNGDVLFKSAYGHADLEKNLANTTDKKFLIGSLTKSFTAVAVMRLVDQEKLSLHVPISTYIPDLKEKLADQLTLHRLMKHQSGLPQHLERLTHFEEKDISSNEILEIINTAERSFTPGTNYQYSNLNYHLAAIAIENVTGKSYPQAMQELVFDPLGMNNSGVERLSNIPDNRANGYRKRAFGLNRDENIVSYALGSGDIYSTVDDLLKWEQSLYGDEFLSRESVDRLFSAESKSFGYYGYGFRIRDYQRAGEESNRGTLTRHGGSMDGFLSNLHRYTDDKLTVIVLANVRSFPIRKLTFELKEIALGMDDLKRDRWNCNKKVDSKLG
ncbi:MAG: beta-lactamase family protein [Balneolaceae bacterium]|nr:beta-lactamase family protein [Balneolaceae bacterium]